MTLEEKIAQLGSLWIGASGDGEGDDGVAPMQDQFSNETPQLDEVISNGLGQLTRVYGTRPVEPEAGMRALTGLQEKITAASRFGIPAVAHEECLTGFAAWKATIFPAPLSWGAAFNPVLVQEMARSVGEGMRAVGVHQGLSPVVDVTRDHRWGRTEETIGEDPYLVGTIGAAYVTGLQEAGVEATLKHFAGYSASKAARNQAPVSIGPREFADVILPPFEMGIRAGVKSVMPSYTDIDGVPASGDPELLTRLLRECLGFDGLVVSDYFAVSFLEMQHQVAGSMAEAAGLALAAGIDVELPSVRCYGQPLIDAVRAGDVPAGLIDRAATRVLASKCELGLLDPDWAPIPKTTVKAPDLDSPGNRAIARELAEESVVLLANDGDVLPLSPEKKIAVVGPLADDKLAFFGCYSMPRHLGPAHPEAADSVETATLLEALRAEIGDVAYAAGCAVTGEDESGFDEAVAKIRSADVVVAVVGDVAGLFGRGTSGEGCDAADLTLPGVQEKLLHAAADTGKPVIAVLVTGRPYAIGPVAERCAAVVQAFFPGEEGGHAVAGVLTGRVNPSGKLPVEIPGAGSPQPSTYLRTANASKHGGTMVDPTPLFAFGHGLSYTTFGYSGLAVSAPEVATDKAVDVSVTVTNTGSRDGAEVVQLYLSDPVAQVVRPLKWLAGFARVPLAAGASARVTFTVHADRTSFTGRSGTRIVEPGAIGVAVGGSSEATPLTGSFTLTGPVRETGADRVLDTPVTVDPVA
ncbi:MAG: glycoside hydrolase family 3 C-terminal domain-containing protein [Actinomycetia bacterium]|nr:glycoside hydrolase family 3 C-terminal domain-containing protein [Actinomycetes bacterium]